MSVELEALDHAVEAALGNPLVLSIILRNLPLQDLKSTRRVSQLWFQESKTLFYQKGTIAISLAYMDEETPRYCSPLKTMTFDHFLKDLCKRHQNIKIDAFCALNGQKKSYFKKKLATFLKSKASSIKSLHLNLRTESINLEESVDIQFYYNFLRIFSELEEFQLNLNIRGWDEIEENFVPEDDIMPLPNLKKLILICSNEGEGTNGQIRQFFMKLVQLSANITHLYIPSYTSFNEFYLKDVVKLQDSWFEDESNDGEMPFNDLGYLHFGSWTASLLDSCLDLKQPLRLLTINLTSLEGNYHKVQRLLEENSNYLERLYFVYRCQFGSSKIQLPDMPQLKSLSFDIPNYHGHYGQKSVDLFRIKKLFSEGSKKFEERFPKLTSLELNLKFIPATEAIDIFLPRDDPNLDFSFKQITHFKMPFKCEDWLTGCKLGNKLRQMFPNV